MSFTEPQRRKLGVSLRFIAFGICAGLFFVLLSDGFSDWYPIRNGIIIGFLIAAFAAIFELNFYEKRIRKHRFIVIFLIRSIFYLIIIVAVILFVIC